MQEETQNATLEDLRERYGDYPVWAAIQRAYNLGVDVGFCAAAKTPSAWYVEDHGEVFKLGDRVWRGDREYEITGFTTGADGCLISELNRSYNVRLSRISRTQPDSWEKLQADITNAVNSVCMGEYEAARFITRAKKLGGCDE